MFMSLNFVVAVSVVIAGCLCAAEPALKSPVDTSPRSKCALLCEDRKGGGSEVYIYLESSGEQTKLLVDRTERYLKTEWSTDGRFLSVENHQDGHFSSIRIFKVYIDRISGKDVLQVQEAYHSPAPTRYDTFWSLLGWDTQAGTVRLKCKFRDFPDESVGRGDWITREFEVPIDYKSGKIRVNQNQGTDQISEPGHRRHAPRQPPEVPPPAKPGSAPQSPRPDPAR